MRGLRSRNYSNSKNEALPVDREEGEMLSCETEYLVSKTKIEGLSMDMIEIFTHNLG